MKVIDQKTWNWTLYQHNDEYILSVLCGSVAMYGREVVLSPNEISEYLDHGIDQLAKKITYEPSKYKSRQIIGFHDDPAVKNANEEWRNIHKSQT
ncbi:hypothetical protein CW745_15360 [Psychromonas sp. psych-6C06]|uniref:hypothetical protein n=1 Tax=Psychromonas sp. psych-6C06 TaxID=2058089 RepID=UPI000C33FD8A|nr:hypothetical protein [Psychromonas sp. psych-6C06]PKF60441.1 hypothetical protein CW745_15360 [Psychromonas sp. psych-6C06]